MNFEVTGHKPVLLKELVDAIKPKENETFFDSGKKVKDIFSPLLSKLADLI